MDARERSEFWQGKAGLAGCLWVFVATLSPAAAGQAQQHDVQYGLAARYPGDVGIANDPDVILFEDYELADMDQLRAKGWRWSPGAEGKVYTLSGDPAQAFAGKRCLVKRAEAGQNGAIMPHDLDPPAS